MPSSTVLITGAKGGIGKGLLSAYALRPNTTAIAAIRDGPNSAAAKDLQSLAVGQGSKIIVATYNALEESSGDKLVAVLAKDHGIAALDVVIANAGIFNQFGVVANIKAAELQEHFIVNTLAPILLYRATASFLNKSQQTPKFFIISTIFASNAFMDQGNQPILAYGMSKAGVNFAAGRIHREEEKIVVVPIHPGFVQTAMGFAAADLIGMSKSDIPTTIADSVAGLVKVIDSATKKEQGGKFLDFTGAELPW